MKNFSNQLIDQLDQKLVNIIPLVEEDPVQNCSLAIKILMEGYERLRNTYINKITSEEEEIDFFKNCKPKLTSQIIYFNEMYNLEFNKPVASEKTIRKYYATQLKKTEQFFIENTEFYKYYRTRNQYLDEKYFLRNQQDGKWVMDSFYFQVDKLFATPHDYTVAQILAYEKLQSYLIKKLKNPETTNNNRQEKVLKWTGSKVGMIELIYALHSEGVFNHGAADVREIVQVFSKAFDTDLGQFHRTFNEITNRKTERTKFISALKDNLINRMNLMDEY